MALSDSFWRPVSDQSCLHPRSWQVLSHCSWEVTSLSKVPSWEHLHLSHQTIVSCAALDLAVWAVSTAFYTITDFCTVFIIVPRVNQALWRLQGACPWLCKWTTLLGGTFWSLRTISWNCQGHPFSHSSIAVWMSAMSVPLATAADTIRRKVASIEEPHSPWRQLAWCR